MEFYVFGQEVSYISKVSAARYARRAACYAQGALRANGYSMRDSMRKPSSEFPSSGGVPSSWFRTAPDTARARSPTGPFGFAPLSVSVAVWAEHVGVCLSLVRRPGRPASRELGQPE